MITEDELARVVEMILSERPGNEASFAQLIAEIPNRVSLGPDDLARSPTRPAEAVWEQRVRNIKSHKNFRGRMVSVPGGLRLTSKVTA